MVSENAPISNLLSYDNVFFFSVNGIKSNLSFIFYRLYSVVLDNDRHDVTIQGRNIERSKSVRKYFNSF